jgi:hypothetical protein
MRGVWSTQHYAYSWRQRFLCLHMKRVGTVGFRTLTNLPYETEVSCCSKSLLLLSSPTLPLSSSWWTFRHLGQFCHFTECMYPSKILFGYIYTHTEYICCNSTYLAVLHYTNILSWRHVSDLANRLQMDTKYMDSECIRTRHVHTYSIGLKMVP